MYFIAQFSLPKNQNLVFYSQQISSYFNTMRIIRIIYTLCGIVKTIYIIIKWKKTIKIAIAYINIISSIIFQSLVFDTIKYLISVYIYFTKISPVLRKLCYFYRNDYISSYFIAHVKIIAVKYQIKCEIFIIILSVGFSNSSVLIKALFILSL